MMLGVIYDSEKKYQEAESHYRTALDINPEFIPAANNLAYLLVAQDKDLNEALSLAQKAKEKLPKNPAVMDTLGWIYYKKGAYDMAVLELSDSLEKLPKHPVVRYHLGLALYKKGDKAKAKAELEKALELKKDFEGAEEARKLLKKL